MPNLKSAKKRMRQNEKRYLRNKDHKSAMRTQVKKFLKYIETGDVEGATLDFPVTISKLDRVAQKGIFHKRNIDRQKAKLHRKFNHFLAEHKED